MSLDLKDCLAAINPAGCSYKEWCDVGMALKHEGYSVADWEAWSARDSARYHPGECVKKWETFRQETGEIVTGGTLVTMAKQHGWKPSFHGEDVAFGWEDSQVCGGGKTGGIIDKNWLEGQELTIPSDASWKPEEDLTKYLETLFQPNEYIGYVAESMKQDDKFVPANRGIYSRTAGEIVELLRQGKDISEALSSEYDRECGAWIRFNPLDGKGVKNANVADYRYALIESDSMSLEKQNALIRELELPVAALVYSGGKSLHAIVRIDAKDYPEYRKRVDDLYKACEKNGLKLDTQNRNPSRLSRMPGVTRAGRKQFLVAVNIGKADYLTWREWYEEQTDDLPDFENLGEVWDDLPPLAPPLIDGVLRQGHKLLLSGPSKAGKSFALTEMTIAIAEGLRWMGWPCTRGKVVYVNFELDRPSCLHRFADVYRAMGIKTDNRDNIEIWNLRGKSMQLDKLAPKLIRRAKKVRPLAIILDPIYKALTGDENSAEQMALFCNQFDRVCSEVGCSVIYCHHHSKGAQGGKKAMDRASGSGVFARDPDALLDLIELPLKESNYDFLKGKAACKAIIAYLDSTLPKGWRDDLGPDDFLSKFQLMEYCKGGALSPAQLSEAEAEAAKAEHHAEHTTAWRISCTLREYERPDDRDVYFAWPVHVADTSGALKDIRPEVEVGGRVVQPRDKSDGSHKEDKAKKERQQVIDAYTLIAAEKEPEADGRVVVRIGDMVERSAEFFGKEMTKPAIRKKIDKYGDLVVTKGVVLPAAEAAENDAAGGE